MADTGKDIGYIKELADPNKLDVHLYTQNAKTGELYKPVLSGNQDIGFYGVSYSAAGTVDIIKRISDKNGPDIVIAEYSSQMTPYDAEMFWSVIRQVGLQEQALSRTMIRPLQKRDNIPVVVIASDTKGFREKLAERSKNEVLPREVRVVDKGLFIENAGMVRGGRRILNELAQIKAARLKPIAKPQPAKV